MAIVEYDDDGVRVQQRRGCILIHTNGKHFSTFLLSACPVQEHEPDQTVIGEPVSIR